MHNQKVQRLRFLCDDASRANRLGAKKQVGQGANAVEQCPVLVQHDTGVEHGK